MQTYTVRVRTGEEWGAGTDANVFIRLTGTRGVTQYLPLLEHAKTPGVFDPRDWFERGKVDEFDVIGKDVGDISLVELYQDQTGPGSDWFVDWVQVEDVNGVCWTAQAKAWVRPSAMLNVTSKRRRSPDGEGPGDQPKWKLLGPILGFRGEIKGAWRVSCLLVTTSGVNPPRLEYAVTGSAPRHVDNPARIKEYQGHGAWRYDWEVELQDHHVVCEYKIDGLRPYDFHVPPRGSPPRIMFATCNGAPDPGEMKKLKWPYLMWSYARRHHEENAFHILAMGGDQVYADPLWVRCDTLFDWQYASGDDDRNALQWTEDMRQEVADFYWRLYLFQWSRREPAWVFAHVPSIMMWDDHDIFDGWGSYEDERQQSPVYQGIFREAREMFRVFQLRADAAWLVQNHAPQPLPEHFDKPLTFACQAGPVGFLALDMRSQRSYHQVMGEDQYAALEQLLAYWTGLSHLFVISGIPIVFVELDSIEKALDLMPGRQELEDDLKDHWDSPLHKKERVRLIKLLLNYADRTKTRVTVLTGDVHVGGLGVVQTPVNHSAIYQPVSSGIVAPPPPHGLQVAYLTLIRMHRLSEFLSHVFGRWKKRQERVWSRLLPIDKHHSIFVWRQNFIELTPFSKRPTHRHIAANGLPSYHQRATPATPSPLRSPGPYAQYASAHPERQHLLISQAQQVPQLHPFFGLAPQMASGHGEVLRAASLHDVDWADDAKNLRYEVLTTARAPVHTAEADRTAATELLVRCGQPTAGIGQPTSPSSPTAATSVSMSPYAASYPPSRVSSLAGGEPLLPRPTIVLATGGVDSTTTRAGRSVAAEADFWYRCEWFGKPSDYDVVHAPDLAEPARWAFSIPPATASHRHKEHPRGPMKHPKQPHDL